MKLVRMKIDRYEGYANRPAFILTAENVPGADELRYEVRDGCYFAEKNGLVRFYYYTKPGDGFGGSKFLITMTDGTEKELIGPWSSRAGVMNGQGFKPCLEVVLNGFASAVTVEWLESQGIPCKAIDSHGETIYEPVDGRGEFYKPLNSFYKEHVS